MKIVTVRPQPLLPIYFLVEFSAVGLQMRSHPLVGSPVGGKLVVSYPPIGAGLQLMIV